MRRKALSQILCATIVFLFLAAASAYAEQAPLGHFEPVTVRDGKGQERELPVPDKKATVLVFLSCECPIANAFAPEIKKIAEQFEEDGVALFRVYPASYESPEDIEAHTREFGYSIPSIQDLDHDLVRRCGADVTPEAVAIDSDGNIVYRGRINNLYSDVGQRRRTPSTADLRDALTAVLEGKPIERRETQAFGCFISPVLPDDAGDSPTPESPSNIE